MTPDHKPPAERVPRTAAGWRKKIGCLIRYTRIHEALWRSGYVEDVRGRNLLVSGDYEWIPHLRDVTIVHDPNRSQGHE